MLMKPNELFDRIKNADYVHTGLSADYSLAIYKRMILVMFEESNGTSDWIMNFLFFPTLFALPILWIVAIFNKKYRGISKYWYAHLGMTLVWMSMKDEVITQVKDLHNEHLDYDIISCGWSHGGGQAQLCALTLAPYLGIKITLVTFGSLRIIWGFVNRLIWALMDKTIFKLFLKDDSAQYENGSDIVPHVPFKFMGYKSLRKVHVGEPFSIFKIFGTPKYHTDYGNPDIY